MSEAEKPLQPPTTPTATTGTTRQVDVALAGSFTSMNATSGGEDTPMNVQADGAVGKDTASKVCPPGSKCDLSTHEGDRSWMVMQHAPHAHGNMTVPQLAQASGPPVPSDVGATNVGMSMPPHGKPMHTLAHVAKLQAHTRDWGHEGKCSFTKPGEMDEDAKAKMVAGVKGDDVAADDEGEDAAMSVDSQGAAEGYLGF
jgi:hypothetical protein